MKHNLPAPRMGSLVPGHMRREGGSPVSYEPRREGEVGFRRGGFGPAPWKTPAAPVPPRFADAPNPPAASARSGSSLRRSTTTRSSMAMATSATRARG
jgi:hypothetical protein